MPLSIFPLPGRKCPICGYNYGGSHYHCGRCGKEGSYQGCYGSKDGKTWGFSCKPEDVEKWEGTEGRMARLNAEVIEVTAYPSVRDIADEISGLSEDTIFAVIERLLDGEDELVYRVQKHVKEITDRWEAQDNA